MMTPSLFRSRPRRARGFGLLGVILVVMLGLSVSGVGYMVYQQGNQAREVNQSREGALALNAAIQKSYANAANYSTLTQARLVQEKLVPSTLLDAAGTPRNTWGGPILVTAMDVGGVTGRGFALTYEQVPTTACVRFATQGAAGFADTLVNGQTIMTNHSPQIGAATQLCAQSDANIVQFRQVKSAGTAAVNPELTPCVTQPKQFQDVACPAGQTSSNTALGINGIHQGRTSFCNSAYGAMAWNPWTTESSTCVPMCSTRLATPTWAQKTSSQPVPNCPAGQISVSNQSGTMTAACASPGAPVDPVWGPWVWTGGSCAPTCATRLATPAWAQQISSRAPSCPAGYLPTSNQTGTNTASCAAPGAAVDPVWGGVVWTGGSCAPACVAPATSSYQNTQWVGVNAGCPAGYTGSHTYEKQQVQTVTTTYRCPAPTGGYTSTPSAGGWGDTGATRNDNNTCRSATPPRYVQTAAGCTYQNYPSGGVGATGGCSNRSGQYVNITENAYWSWWNPNWQSNMPSNPPMCSQSDLIAMDYYGQSANCTRGKSSGIPPASCSVGQTFYYAQYQVSLDCGQSGNIYDCQLAESYNYTEYACQQ